MASRHFHFRSFRQIGLKVLTQQNGRPILGGDTRIGHDVWIGRDATILPGVTVGNGAIIGSNAVVAKDVPAYAIVVGNPAKIVKMRFHTAEITRLQQIAWWHWPVEKITKHKDAIMGADMAQLEKASLDDD